MQKKYKLLFLLSIVRAGSMLAMEQEDDFGGIAWNDFDRSEYFESNDRSDGNNNRSNLFNVDNNRPKDLLNSIKVRHIENKIANNGRIITKLSERMPLVNDQVKFQIISIDKSYEEIISQQLGKKVRVDLFTMPLFSHPIAMIKSLSNDPSYHNKLANILSLLTFDAIWIEGDENQYCYVNIKPLEKLIQKQKKLGNVQSAIELIQAIKINAGQVGHNQTYCHVDITPLEKEKFELQNIKQNKALFNAPFDIEIESEFDIQIDKCKNLMSKYGMNNANLTMQKKVEYVPFNFTQINTFDLKQARNLNESLKKQNNQTFKINDEKQTEKSKTQEKRIYQIRQEEIKKELSIPNLENCKTKKELDKLFTMQLDIQRKKYQDEQLADPLYQAYEELWKKHQDERSADPIYQKYDKLNTENWKCRVDKKTFKNEKERENLKKEFYASELEKRHEREFKELTLIHHNDPTKEESYERKKKYEKEEKELKNRYKTALNKLNKKSNQSETLTTNSDQAGTLTNFASGISYFMSYWKKQ